MDTLREDQYTFLIMFRSLLGMGHVSNKRYKENKKHSILC